MTFDDMEFLWWFQMTCMFRDDMLKDMLSIGFDYPDAFYLSRTEAVQQKNAVKLWENESINGHVLKYFNHCREKFDAIRARQKS